MTFYDDATGERVELSVATFANWVAKTANLLQDDLAAEPGDRLALLLPAHWQTAVWLLACSSVGVVVDVQGDPADASIVVSGPDTLESARACGGERVALSLRPLGARFPQPPEGFADYAVEVPGQGDQFMPYEPVDPAHPLRLPGERRAELTGARTTERAARTPPRSASRPDRGCCRAARTTVGPGSAPDCSPRSPPAARSCCAATPSGSTPPRSASVARSERVTHTID